MDSAHLPDNDPTIPRRGGRRVETTIASARSTGVPVTAGVTAPGSGAMPREFTQRFVLGPELGRGGMGTVRLAEDPELGRELAIKFLHSGKPDAVLSFTAEAQITSQLQHPNIVPVYELGRDPSGRPWLAMKRIDGRSLAEVINDRKAAHKGRGRHALRQEDFNEILGLFAKVCDAVAFAHNRGVIHRDLKPHNIMVGAYGEVLVVDWGLARPVDRSAVGRPAAAPGPAPAAVRVSARESGDIHSMEGDIFGTPAYMPPEQALGRIDEIDERADVFALGAVLYHMLTLETPYQGRTAIETLSAAAHHDLTPPRRRAPGMRIPRELQAIVLKAMARKPDDRYGSVAGLKADIEAWQTWRPSTAWRAGLLERAMRWARRNPRTALAGGMCLLFAAVIAAIVAIMAQQVAAADARAAIEREARVRELASRRKWEDVAHEIGARVENRRDESLDELDRLYNAAMERGLPPDQLETWLTRSVRATGAHSMTCLPQPGRSRRS
ncbi:MAG: serine/threonine-protein kinase [Planctomycetota bacterium]